MRPETKLEFAYMSSIQVHSNVYVEFSISNRNAISTQQCKLPITKNVMNSVAHIAKKKDAS